MKRILSALIIISLLIFLCSCGEKSNNESANIALNVSNYTEIECRNIPSENWRVLKIQNPDNNMALQFSAPNDWEIKTVDKNTLNIIRNDHIIGAISTREFKQAKETFAHCSESKVNTDVSMQIELKEFNGKNQFYHFYEMEGVQDLENITFKMQILYNELNQDAAYKLMSSVICPPKIAPIPPLSETNDSKKIMIIGNSFVNTSKIGDFLQQMLINDNNTYSVTPVSIGMASVIRFANDYSICNRIENGEFAYIFMCGFYSKEDIQSLYTIKEACQKSNTKLIIFPAHNESRDIIDAALLEHSDVHFLDWKGEIDALIDNGINYYNFCVDDYHKHSTPLAGYVGARMIFKSLFNTPVKDVSRNLPIDDYSLNVTLKDYIESDGKISNYTIETYNLK